jgi:wobble nucleotide-excising tRNase
MNGLVDVAKSRDEQERRRGFAIGDGKVAAGARSDTEPTFKTVLSAGDKTTLALAFFLAQVRADASLKDSVVVLDDPFNGQDMQRQFETTSQIRTLAAQSEQVIVMSHDPRFLQMIERDWRGPVITLQIQCSTAGDGAVSSWSSSDELKTLYVRNSEIIREYASHGALLKGVTEVTILQAIRPFLEDHIRARFPGRFNEVVMLDEMTTTIEQAGSSDPLYGHVADLRALNEFTRPGMHGGAQPPDPVALCAQCKRVVALVGAY